MKATTSDAEIEALIRSGMGSRDIIRQARCSAHRVSRIRQTIPPADIPSVLPQPQRRRQHRARSGAGAGADAGATAAAAAPDPAPGAVRMLEASRGASIDNLRIIAAAHERHDCVHATRELLRLPEQAPDTLESPQTRLMRHLGEMVGDGDPELSAGRQALRRRLYGADSWAPWRRLLAALDGQRPLDRHGADLLGVEPRWLEPPSEVWCVAGRRSGKTTMAALTAVLEVLRPREPAPGERLVALLIGRDLRQADVLMERCRAIVRMLGIEPEGRDRATRLDLPEGRTIECAPCQSSAVRSRTCVAAVLDEAAYYRHETTHELLDREVVEALRPSLLQTGGRLWVISSPWMRAGMLYDAHAEHFGRPSRDIAVVQAPTRRLNPTISTGEIERAIARSPEAQAAEWEAVFRAGSQSYLPDAVLDGIFGDDDDDEAL